MPWVAPKEVETAPVIIVMMEAEGRSHWEEGTGPMEGGGIVAGSATESQARLVREEAEMLCHVSQYSAHYRGPW